MNFIRNVINKLLESRLYEYRTKLTYDGISYDVDIEPSKSKSIVAYVHNAPITDYKFIGDALKTLLSTDYVGLKRERNASPDPSHKYLIYYFDYNRRK